MMMTAETLIPSKLRGFEPYEPVSGVFRIRLDANESPYNINADIKERLKASLDSIEFNRYPDPSAAGLCGGFSAAYGVDTKHVVAGNGSDELISLLAVAFLEKGDGIAVLRPDFSMYSFYASLSEAKINVFDRPASGGLDALAESVARSGSRLVIFSNPCNPTGAGYDRESVLRFASSLPAICVIDEAYMDFWDRSILRDAPQTENIIVLRTLSKALGSACLRLGFAVANERFVSLIKSVKSPYNVNGISQEFGRIILQSGKNRGRELGEKAKALGARLAELLPSAEVFDTCTNFVYIKTPAAAGIFRRLADEGIAVRCFDGALRITAGTDAENAALLEALGRLPAELK